MPAAMATEPIPPRPDDDAVDDVVWTEASLREIDAAVRRHSLPRLQSAADHLDNSEAAAGARGINLAAAADGELGIPAGLDAQLQELDSGLIRTRAAFRHCRACFGLLLLFLGRLFRPATAALMLRATAHVAAVAATPVAGGFLRPAAARASSAAFAVGHEYGGG